MYLSACLSSLSALTRESDELELVELTSIAPKFVLVAFLSKREFLDCERDALRDATCQFLEVLTDCALSDNPAAFDLVESEVV